METTHSARNAGQSWLRQGVVVGYGSQGRAHLRNLGDGGFNVVVGARAGGAAERKARPDAAAEAVRSMREIASFSPVRAGAA